MCGQTYVDKEYGPLQPGSDFLHQVMPVDQTPSAAARRPATEALPAQVAAPAETQGWGHVLEAQAARASEGFASLWSEEAGLEQQRIALEVREQQLAQESAKQRRELQERADQIDRDERMLIQDRERLTQTYQQRLGEIDKARRQLRREGHELEMNKGRLEKEAATIAAEREEINRRNGELELLRRRLEEGWQRLRAEQGQWRDEQSQEDSSLRQQSLELQERAATLQSAQEQWEQKRREIEKDLQLRAQEINGLEARVRSYRLRLAALQREVSSIEATLVPAAASPVPPSTVSIETAAGNEEVLRDIVGIVQELEDESRRLREEHDLLLNIKQLWQSEWEIALAELRVRDRELDERNDAIAPREQSVRKSEHVLQRRSSELELLRQRLQCWEAQLFKQQITLKSERKRLMAVVRIRAASVRERHQLAARLQMEGEDERRREIKRYRELQDACEQERQQYRRLTERVRRLLSKVEERDRRITERELVLQRVQEELLAQDPQPVAAQRELERRQRHWQRLAALPLRHAHRQKQQTRKEARQLEGIRQQLLAERRRLEENKAEYARLTAEFQVNASDWKAERIRREHDLKALHAERSGLLQQIQELHAQIERLALVFVSTDRPLPPLALAA